MSCFEYLDFLLEEFVDMIQKQQWVMLPYSAVKIYPACDCPHLDASYNVTDVPVGSVTTRGPK